MKKTILIILSSLISIITYSQINYEQAYFIKNNDEKVSCLIKNLDWKNNPSSFNYKINDTTEILTANIEGVKEFGFTSNIQYVRFNVKMDRSSDLTGSLSPKKEPEFNNETLFLKVLVKGIANLYKYEDKSLIRFFYSTNHTTPEQLVYKRYITDLKSHLSRSCKKVSNDDKTICFNKSYKKQLYDELSSSNISKSEIQKISYKQKSLTNFFESYNKSNDANFKALTPQKRDRFNLYLTAGVDQVSLSVINSASTNRSADFGDKTLLKLGFEAEFTLPFNKNKWSAFISPSFLKFSGTEQLAIQTATIDYKSLELPIGIRHYLFLNSKSKFHIDGLLAFNTDLNSTLKYSVSQTDIDIKPDYNFAIGIGYDYKNNASIEARYYSNRNLISNVSAMKANYETLSLTLKIKLL